ncbi:MAG TPA: low affinity iron permease family protein [Alphaproteobacteria bacterium]|nr:low affinity iron permease family protein [Alphaproteobacteria bacterium]
MKLRDRFNRFANRVAQASGKPVTFVTALTVIVLWGLSGPFFGFAESWQLVVNTGTTIITFLMVFVLQNTQNRDSEALHAKLDELILKSDAENSFIEAERLSEDEIKHLRELVEKAAGAPLATGEKGRKLVTLSVTGGG